MVHRIVCLCDMCDADGEQTLAVAIYWNEDDEAWHVCDEHLENVRAAKLCYKLLGD